MKTLLLKLKCRIFSTEKGKIEGIYASPGAALITKWFKGE